MLDGFPQFSFFTFIVSFSPLLGNFLPTKEIKTKKEDCSQSRDFPLKFYAWLLVHYKVNVKDRLIKLHFIFITRSLAPKFFAW